jgi:spermidine synthase
MATERTAPADTLGPTMERDRRPDLPPSEAAPATALAPRTPLGLLRSAALLSGITALAAQTVWVRALGRGLGTTTEALAAVAAVFLGGLGLGAVLGGRLATRTPSPALAAGRCLLLAAVLVLVSPWLFDVLPGLHLLVLGLLGADPGPSPWPALLVGLPLLLVPTVLMGATFPLLLAASRTGVARAGRGTGGLYALNTFGAALGAAITVMALGVLGERLTLSVAAGLEILAGALLLLRGPVRETTSDQAPPPVEAPTRGAPTPLSLCGALLLTGLAGLGVEVTAFRLLEPVTGPHLWGVTLLLVPVLVGIALGGWIGGRIADRSPAPARTLATAMALAGALVAASLWIAGLLPWMLFSGGATGGAVRLTGLALGTALVLLPPLAALGATFPLAVRAAAERGTSPARASGDLTGWNALGAVAGSLLAGFLLLPAWGAPTTLVALAWLLPAGGALLRLVTPGAPQGSARALPALATALPLFVLGVPAVLHALLDAAPALPEVAALNRRPTKREASAPEPPRANLPRPEDMRLYAEWFGGRPVRPEGDGGAPFPARDGRLGSVALLEEPGGTVRLRVNGLSEARFLPDDPDAGSRTEVALALLPCLAHPAPKRALVIGHGAGWTAEAMLAADVPWVDIAELDETLLDVVEEWRGLRRWYLRLEAADKDADGRVTYDEWSEGKQDFARLDADRNGWLDRSDPPVIRRLAARTDPRAHLALTDGRLLLRLAAADPARRYDVIASQPSHPWVPGAGHLFTREAYALAREALQPDGVFAQWLNLFEMSEPLLRSSLATFRDVFPTCWLFLFENEAVLLGFAGEPHLDTARWERMLAPGGDLRRVSEPAGIHTAGDLWGRLTLDAAGIERLAPASSTPLVVDDRPALELGLAWRVLGNAEDEDLEKVLRREFPPDLARLLPDRVERDRMTALAIDGLLTAGQGAVALLWDDKVVWGTDPLSRVVRAAVARARGDMPRAGTILRGVVDELVAGPPLELPAHGDWVAGWIALLSETARADPRLRASLLADAQPVADRLPRDGRVRAAMALLRDRANDVAGARRAERRLQALDAKEADEAFRTAWARLIEGLGIGLPDAYRAADRAPTRVEAWEVMALTRLQLHALARHPDERRVHRAEALRALGRGLAVAEDPDRAEARARAYLAWFGVDADGLQRVEAE